MKINTDKFGEIEFDEGSVIEFIDGLLGFSKNKKYVLINAQEDASFRWLQSLEDAALAFLVVDPAIFKPDYDVKLDDDIKRELEITSRDDYITLVILVVDKNPLESTANLLGPLVINVRNKKARQVVLTNTGYTTRHKIIGSGK